MACPSDSATSYRSVVVTPLGEIRTLLQREDLYPAERLKHPGISPEICPSRQREFPMWSAGRCLHGERLYGSSFHGWYHYAVITRTLQQDCTEGTLFMTSEERREIRYQRRKAKRDEARLKRSMACGDFDEVFSFRHLYLSAKSVVKECIGKVRLNGISVI